MRQRQHAAGLETINMLCDICCFPHFPLNSNRGVLPITFTEAPRTNWIIKSSIYTPPTIAAFYELLDLLFTNDLCIVYLFCWIFTIHSICSLFRVKYCCCAQCKVSDSTVVGVFKIINTFLLIKRYFVVNLADSLHLRFV